MDAASAATLRKISRIAIEYHDNLVPGSLDALRSRLQSTHHLKIVPAPMRTCGMVFAKLKP
jgi:hypothetical protein